jgi:hypothetical protein
VATADLKQDSQDTVVANTKKIAAEAVVVVEAAREAAEEVVKVAFLRGLRSKSQMLCLAVSACL